MIQTQLKLRINVTQETLLNSWLFMLTGVWNWAIRKIEHDAHGEVYYSAQAFQNLLAGHGQKIGIPSHTLQGVLLMAHTAWNRCFKLSLERLGKAQRGINLEVASRNSTRTCSACGCLSGPTGLAGLSVRTWVCAECGTPHDRDQNAAINTLMAGVGTTLEWDLRLAA